MKNESVARGNFSRRLGYATGLLGLLAMAALLPHPARAMSAFSAGIPDNVADRGVAVGAGYNYGTRAEAETRAMQECQKQGEAPADTRALCKIVAYFDNECLSVSMDPKAGTPGFGWAISPNKQAADDQALANCRETAGSDRVAYCQVSMTDCDGYAK